jgi:2-hydroxychromene-2-carboxylate isomerase
MIGAVALFFDVISSFSWLVLPAVEAIAARHRVRFRPVVLGALLQHWGQVGPSELPPKRISCAARARPAAPATGSSRAAS